MSRPPLTAPVVPPRAMPFTAALAAAALGLLVAAAPPAAGQEAIPPAAAIWTEPRSGIELVRLPAGSYAMGAVDGGADERPAHPVRVAAFSLGRFEVTQRQWRTVTGGSPSHHAGCDDCPVEQVSWEDVQIFLRRAAEASGVRMRLPTEAEWEYAAGAGAAHTRWPGTDDAAELVLFIWSKGSFAGRTHPVGQKRANAFGLHDLGGNVAEWCADRYDPEAYGSAAAEEGPAPGAGERERRVVRGGSFIDGPDEVRTSRRQGTLPDARRRSIGFRVAVDGG